MKVATKDLIGAALDWAVIVALYGKHDPDNDGHLRHFLRLREGQGPHRDACYSENWHRGGPIIEREGILLRPIRCEGHEVHGLWLAMKDGKNTGRMVQWVEFQFGNKGQRRFWRGPTALIAAMRCFVASQLGDFVEIPDELAA